ncbi:hypothetical protein [Bacillus sp. FJAT-44742]|uniref:hypothetical protein n=1 Tax=Bacillus sp. FJAT-44742 TaxID=2014005 RepID=UPI000C249E85|nr:hypothetical protein [Bacillus sp. FJAT-44742]
MENKKENLIKAYSYIYDIETILRKEFTSNAPSLSFKKDLSFWQLISLQLDYDNLSISGGDKQKLRRTVSIRNKVCHMKPITYQELMMLKQVHSSLKNLHS